MSVEQIPAELQTDMLQYVGRNGAHHIAAVLGPNPRYDQLQGCADGEWSWYLNGKTLSYGKATTERPRTAPKKPYGWGDWAVHVPDLRRQRQALPRQAAALDAAAEAYRTVWLDGCQTFREQHPQPADRRDGNPEWMAWLALNSEAMTRLHQEVQPLLDAVSDAVLALLPLGSREPGQAPPAAPVQLTIFDLLDGAA